MSLVRADGPGIEGDTHGREGNSRDAVTCGGVTDAVIDEERGRRGRPRCSASLSFPPPSLPPPSLGRYLIFENFLIFPPKVFKQIF